MSHTSWESFLETHEVLRIAGGASAAISGMKSYANGYIAALEDMLGFLDGVELTTTEAVLPRQAGTAPQMKLIIKSEVDRALQEAIRTRDKLMEV